METCREYHRHEKRPAYLSCSYGQGQGQSHEKPRPAPCVSYIQRKGQGRRKVSANTSELHEYDFFT